MSLSRMYLSLALAVIPAEPSAAQTDATAVAAALQSWRDACGDPNPDLAIGYLRDALATGNIDIRKACLRQILTSDNTDTQSAALRALITSLPVIRFRVGESQGGYVGGRAKEIIAVLQHGLVFNMAKGDITTGTAQWMPLVMNTTPVEAATGTVTVFGTSIHWAGQCYYDTDDFIDCKLSANLLDGTNLTGHMQIGDMTLPVTASLFD